MLEWALGGAPHYARMVEKGRLDPIDYCLGREGRLFDQIGPVAAGGDAIAQALASAALAAAGDRPILLDVFDARDTFAVLAARLRLPGSAAAVPDAACGAAVVVSSIDERTRSPLAEFAILRAGIRAGDQELQEIRRSMGHLFRCVLLAMTAVAVSAVLADVRLP